MKWITTKYGYDLTLSIDEVIRLKETNSVTSLRLSDGQIIKLRCE